MRRHSHLVDLHGEQERIQVGQNAAKRQGNIFTNLNSKLALPSDRVV
jgi:hypothetical protein